MYLGNCTGLCAFNYESCSYVSIQQLRNTFLPEATFVHSRLKVGICCNEKYLTLMSAFSLQCYTAMHMQQCANAFFGESLN